MRTQTATLAAAAKAHSHRAPIVSAVFSDEPCERPRLTLSEVYSEVSPNDTSHAACVTASGAIVRVRVNHADHHVASQRITDPAQAWRWALWADTGFLTSAMHDDPCLDVWCDLSTGVVFLAYMDGAQGNGWYWTYSTDDGVSWAVPQLVDDYGAGIYVRGIAGVASGGQSRIGVLVYVPGPDPLSHVDIYAGDNINLPVWGAGSIPNLAAPRGLGMCDEGDGTLLVWYADKDPIPYDWGADQAPPCLMAREYFPGVGFSDAMVMATAGVGGPITYQAPRVSRVEVETGVYRYVGTWQEISTAPAYQRAMVTFTPSALWPGEAVPWRYPGSWGLEVLQRSGWWYFVQSDRAMRAPIFSAPLLGSRATFDETRVRSVTVREKANDSGDVVLELDNSDGALDSAGLPGAKVCVRPGAQLAIGLGYRTSLGRELVYRQPFWITRVEHSRDGRKRVVTVTARDALGELEGMRARRDLQLAEVAVFTALSLIVARVCGDQLVNPSGRALVATLAPWRVAAGARWSAELARLCRAGGILLRFYNGSATGVGWAACKASWLEYGSGAPAWTIGAGGSPFYQGRWWRAVPDYTSAEVEGTGYLGEARDWDAIWREGRDVVSVVSDRRLGDQVEVDDRAIAEAARLTGSSAGGVVKVALVPGLEVGDVVTVTDSLAGVVAEERYVVGLVSRVQLEKGEASQELTVEAVSS